MCHGRNASIDLEKIDWWVDGRMGDGERKVTNLFLSEVDIYTFSGVGREERISRARVNTRDTTMMMMMINGGDNGRSCPSTTFIFTSFRILF